jgi:hypothetical protein
MGEIVIDQLTPGSRAVPAVNAVSDSSIERVAVEGPPVSATSDEPEGFREKVKAERAAFEAKGAPVAAPLSAEVKPKAAAPAQEPVQEPVQAARAPAPAQAKAPAAEAPEAAQEAPEPVIEFPALIPQPVLLDPGQPPEQGSDENWQEFSARQLRYQARVTANEQTLAEANAKVEARNARVREIQDRELQRVALSWQERKAAAVKERPDFEAVTTADAVAISETMANQIVSIDNGTDVAYHLGKHPAEARRIYDMTPARQIDAVARLSERLKAPATVAAKASASVSKAASAPKPAAPQRSPAPARVATVDLERMSMQDYATYRNEQMRAERR